MNFDVAIDAVKHFMRVTVTGEPAIDELLSLIHLLGVESDNWPEKKVLVDLRGVRTQYTKAEQHRMGEEAAASLHHMARVASLVPPERVTRVSEKAARRSAINLRVFDDEALAVAWLNAP